MCAVRRSNDTAFVCLYVFATEDYGAKRPHKKPSHQEREHFPVSMASSFWSTSSSAI